MQTNEEKNKILALWRELYYKWEITEKELYDSYFELYIKWERENMY
jgi:hypothetical protein